VTTVLLIRHGRTSANASGVLAGWTPGVELDDVGREQATALANRLSALPLAGAITSPLERCQQTAALSLGDGHPEPAIDDRLGECHYGEWTGKSLKVLAKDPLWKVVQSHPSAVRFPGEAGESLLETQNRAVSAIREHNARLGADAVYAVFSHGDVIKSILADALGQHLDQFQRIIVDPCSVSVVHYTELRPFVERMNDRSGDLSVLKPAKKSRKKPASSDAAVGGGSGRRG
jgi:probable phosphomutase (TIGR03848 family)